MRASTIAENKRSHKFDHDQQVWLFGYGSLIFKPDFPYVERRPASLKHWARRFWQGSHDHRGTEHAPGRVVTLIPSTDAVCEGMAYLIDAAVFDHLDYREKNGYLRFTNEITFKDGSGTDALVYIATAENPAYLGPAPELDIARHIAGATGPSGRNDDYVTDLARALRQLGAEDTHVFNIERHLVALNKKDSAHRHGTRRERLS